MMSCGKKNFADVIKVIGFQIEIFYWIVWESMT